MSRAGVNPGLSIVVSWSRAADNREHTYCELIREARIIILLRTDPRSEDNHLDYICGKLVPRRGESSRLYYCEPVREARIIIESTPVISWSAKR